MRTLVIGWGNPIAGDDRLGWRAAELVREHVGGSRSVEVVTTSHGGLRVAERMLGYDRVVVLDAVVRGPEGRAGLVRTEIRPRELAEDGRSMGHDGALVDALHALRRLRPDGLPEAVVLLGAPVAGPPHWDDRPSPPMEEAAGRLARAALAELAFGLEGIAVA